MKHGLKFTAIVMATGALPAIAHAACCKDVPRWYIGVQGGAVWMNDYSTTLTSTITGASAPALPVEYDVGFGFGGKFGYRIAKPVRVEFEIASYQAEMANPEVLNSTPGQSGGELERRNLALMTNIIAEYRTNDNKLVPYAGAGIGALRISEPIAYAPTDGFGTVIERKELEDWVLAWQFLAGVGYKVDNPIVGREDFFSIGYKYLTGQDGEVQADIVPRKVGFEHTSHHIEFGFTSYF